MVIAMHSPHPSTNYLDTECLFVLNKTKIISLTYSEKNPNQILRHLKQSVMYLGADKESDVILQQKKNPKEEKKPPPPFTVAQEMFSSLPRRLKSLQRPYCVGSLKGSGYLNQHFLCIFYFILAVPASADER